MGSPDNSVIRIGAWRVDSALDEISKDDKTVKLEPKLMRLLVCLAAHAGQVVSVEQLLDEVWKDVVVTTDSVYHAYVVAEVHAYRGEIDLALAWLDRAYRQKDAALYWVKGDPLLRNLEANARFKAFLRMMNLPE